MPDKPHKRVPATMATRVAHVLRFSWAPTILGKMTLDSRYWMKAKTAMTAAGYKAESLVTRAMETGMEALMKMPMYGMTIINEVSIPYSRAFSIPNANRPMVLRAPTMQ